MLPVAVHAAANWSPSDARAASPLTPGLVEALRENVARGDVVYSDPQTSYEIAARVPVYIAVAPPGHVADTEKNRPYERRDEALRFFETGDVEILRRAGADWLVVDRKRSDVAPQLDSVYRDGRYTLYVRAVAAAAGRLDAEQVAGHELARRERRQLLAVQQRPSGRAGPAAGDARRRDPAPLREQREPAGLEHA